MASPVGHSLVAVSIVMAWQERFHRRQTVAWCLRYRWTLLAAIFLANVPDLDYVPGMIIGDLNAFHQGITHSLGFVGAFWIILMAAGSLCGMNFRRWALLSALLLVSHLVVDILTADGRAPYGIMLFWPLSEMRVHSPVTIFPMYSKAQLSNLWDLRNLSSLAQEVACSGALLLAVWLYKTRTANHDVPRYDAE